MEVLAFQVRMDFGLEMLTTVTSSEILIWVCCFKQIIIAHIR